MFKRAGFWWTCIRHKGKKIQKSLETSDKKLARIIEAKIRTEIVEGKYFAKPKGENISVKDLLEKYLNEHSRPNKSPRAYQDDVYFSKRIKVFFGRMPLTEVSAKHISEYIRLRRNVVRKNGKKGVSDATINHELRLLRHAYNLAIRSWEVADISPFAKISIPRGDSKRVRYLSEEEEKRLFNVLHGWLGSIVIIARETGLRLSNIANLTWKQVNLFSMTIIIESTKNGDPVGIPMTENVFNTLKELNKVRRIDSDYIFGKNGKPFRRWWISKSF